MAKNKNQNMMYGIGLLLLVFILIKGGGMPFLGAFITTCTNLELSTSDEVITYYSDSAVIRNLESVPYVIHLENATVTKLMDTTQIITNETDIIMYARDDVSCSDYIKYVKTLDQAIDTLYYNQKVATDFNKTFYWCNAANTLTFKGDKYAFMSYVDEFVICVTAEIPDAVEEEIEDIVEDESIVDGGELVTPTISVTEEDAVLISGPVKDDISNNKTILGLVVIAIGLAIYYFGYEQGPKRGLIKK